MEQEQSRSNHKKLLQIAYYFPPMGTIGTLPNYRFARFFLQHFSYCHVISQRSPTIIGADSFSFPQAQVTRVTHFDYRFLTRLFSQQNSSLREQANAQSRTRRVRLFRKLIESFPFNMLIGEGGLIYIVGAVFRGIQLYRQQQFNYLYTSFRPLADHVVAWCLTLLYPKLIWIADFRDLPVDQVRANVFWPNFQEWILKRILNRADLVTCASVGLKTQLSRIHDRVEVVRNGIHELYPIPEPQPTEHFTITYTGSIYPEFHDPKPLFTTIKQLLKDEKVDPGVIRLQYAGKDELVWNRWVEEASISKISYSYGMLKMEEATHLQVNSALNLMFSWSSEDQEGMLTAKLFDYLAARSPILCIVKGPKENELEAIFQNTHAGLLYKTAQPVDSSLYTFVLELYQNWLKNRIASKPIQAESLKAYTTESELNRLLDILKGSR